MTFLNRQLTFCMILATAIVSFGCKAKRKIPQANQPSLDDVASAEQDDITLGYDELLRTFDPNHEQSLSLGIYHLNQWLQKAGASDTQWQKDPLIDRLPKSVAAIQPLQELERLRYTINDARYVHCRLWERDLSNWVAQGETPADVAAWLNAQETRLGTEGKEQLRKAWLYFDWIVRNIQLEAFPAAETTSNADSDLNATPPERGVPGPGYRRYPHETLLFGRGDAFERARLLMEICRAAKIDTVLICARPGNGSLKPWCVGVLIGEEIFLFEAELGLPLPGSAPGSIAALNETAENPDSIRRLDLSEEKPYWLKNEDLGTLEALISAGPEELSKRMFMLERRLVDSRAMVLSVQPTKIAERLRKNKHLSPNVALWRVPFDCTLYQIGFERVLARDQEKALNHSIETFLFQPQFPLFQGRINHLRGRFDSDSERDGATVQYLSSRPPQEFIESLPFSKEFAGPADAKGNIQGRARAEFRAAQLERGKMNASFWLALLAYEKRDFSNAVQWLKERNLEAYPDGPWTFGVKYALARSYETLGKPEDAIRLYQADRSPQSYGNQLRAKFLTAAASAPN